MSLQTPTPSNFIGAQSAHYLSVATATQGLHYLTNASDTVAVGAVVTVPPSGAFAVFVTASDAYGAGESLVLDVRYLDAAGVPVFKTAATLNATTVPAAGRYEFGEVDLDVPPGTVVQLVRTYVAGGTPNDPEIAVLAQLY